ncbi:protein adenylyltransferase SelO [Pantanalinema sp. GBBB05]|uniref:protein adenylyltransferase SelO n=1 Tax=Pantanalinema sp. GBBB05 TaxID=2604139 RepID=UPI001E045448|nr:YdiU family protein [Pantanalinema sp. GBBB05]
MTANPLLTLPYEPALEQLGDDYYDVVSAAQFPTHILRFRNDDLLSLLGLDPKTVQDQDFIAAFGQFDNPPRPLLALRYHGYQFGEYNAFLGDGRGFLYGQVRGTDGELYDFGTKGSGRTPYSRGGDGRLTLKGGVREVLAAEALHRVKVRTSRCLSLIETGESLWRGDEPSPTRSSVMVRFSRSHIRFGTFERLHRLDRKDLIAILLDHVIEHYYPQLQPQPDRYALFYAELVERVATLVAQWMAAGFCHGVLNTDNMSMTGESFDYGPYAFIPTLDPRFTAAYFDYSGRYSYGNQPAICRWNLEMLQAPMSRVIAFSDLEAALAKFEECYDRAYRQQMLSKLGFDQLPLPDAEALLKSTLQFLHVSQIDYHDFFRQLTQQFSVAWQEDVNAILLEVQDMDDQLANLWNTWKITYFNQLLNLPASELEQMPDRLSAYNSSTALLRPAIEAAWEPITQQDDWSQFNQLLEQIRA